MTISRRPRQWFETGDPITADFTFVRWIGDRKGIEERTKVWDKTIIDRHEDLREWAEVLRGVSRRVRVIYGYANNHYAGFAPETIEIFKKLWDGSSDAPSYAPKDEKAPSNRTAPLFPKS